MILRQQSLSLRVTVSLSSSIKPSVTDKCALQGNWLTPIHSKEIIFLPPCLHCPKNYPFLICLGGTAVSVPFMFFILCMSTIASPVPLSLSMAVTLYSNYQQAPRLRCCGNKGLG